MRLLNFAPEAAARRVERKLHTNLNSVRAAAASHLRENLILIAHDINMSSDSFEKDQQFWFLINLNSVILYLKKVTL